VPEEPILPPDPVVIPGDDPMGPLPGADAPEPAAPPEFGGDIPPLEIPGGEAGAPEPDRL
jgi:hypothetical protein